MKRKNKKEKFEHEQMKSFFLILLFAIGGFTIIMLGTLNKQNNQENITDETTIEIELETIAKNIVLNSTIFKEYSDGVLIHENKQKLGCAECFEFTFKFKTNEKTNISENIEGFEYKLIMMQGQIKFTEVTEILKT